MVAALRRCTYDGVTEAANVSAANVATGSGDPPDTISGSATGTAFAAAAIKGAKGVRFISTDGQQRTHQYVHTTQVTTLAGQVYFRIKSTTAVSGPVGFLDIQNSNSPSVASLALNTDGTVTVRTVGAVVRGTSPVLANGVYIAYLCAVRGATTSTGRVIARIRNFSDGTVVWETDVTDANTGTTYNLDKVRVGKVLVDANTLTDLELDEFGYVDSTTTEIDYTTGTKQVTVGQNTATEIGQAVARRKKKNIGQAPGTTQTAQSRAIIQATETATAQVQTATKTSTRILRRLGVYNSDQQHNYAQINTEMGTYPDIASYYWRPTEGWSAPITRFKGWIDLGMAPLVSFYVGNNTTRIENIANNVPADLDWMDAAIDAGQQTALYGKQHGGIPVYWTCTQEWSVHRNKGDLGTPGVAPSTDPAMYGEMMSVFLEHCHNRAPDLKPILWLAGFNSPTDYENPVLTAIRSNVAAYLYAISGDPYANGANDASTAKQTWAKFGNKLRSSGGQFNANYTRLVNNGFTGYVGISEYGKSCADHTAQQIQDYYGPGFAPIATQPKMRQTLNDDDYIFATFFNSDSDKPHGITSGTLYANATACTNYGQEMLAAKTYKFP